MRDMIVGVASGKIEDTVVLDLDKAEDNYGQADLPVGILPNTGEIASYKWMEIFPSMSTISPWNTTTRLQKKFTKSWLMLSSADTKEVKPDG